MTLVRPTLRAALAAAVLFAAPALLPAQEGGTPAPANRPALMIEIDGAIGPASARQVKEALGVAAQRRAEVVVLRLNTPGGLATSMREIVADVIASPVPVIGYVAPSGAHAASAGTFILYATHIAAMAPGTNIGAASPVAIGGGWPGSQDKKDDKDDKDKDGKDKKDGASGLAGTMAAKATNDAVALIRSLAEMRKRNADWGEKAVREAATLTADAALQEKAIDIVARSPADLLRQADGRSVELTGGETRRLATKDLAIERLDPGWLNRLLAVITNPNVAFILLLVGIYGLIFEFTTPGAVGPGVIGAIALLLALYALNMLPVSYAGLALLLLGIAFLVVEIFNPSIVFGLGGLAAFLLGAAMLFDFEAPGFRLSWTVVVLAAAMIVSLSVVVLGSLWRTRKGPARVGAGAMRGLPAEVLDWSGREGHVFAHGERWQARATEALSVGETVEVAGINDLTLLVQRRPVAASHPLRAPHAPGAPHTPGAPHPGPLPTGERGHH